MLVLGIESSCDETGVALVEATGAQLPQLLADMATKQQAARLLTLNAAEKLDAGERADMEAGMAKLFASEAAMQIALDAIRVHGGYGYSKEYDVERYFRDAPLMIVGEGTNEIQRIVIARGLLARVPRIDAITSAEYPTPARRPANSRLDSTRAETGLGLDVPDWRAGLASILDEWKSA